VCQQESIGNWTGEERNGHVPEKFWVRFAETGGWGLWNPTRGDDRNAGWRSARLARQRLDFELPQVRFRRGIKTKPAWTAEAIHAGG